MAKYKDGIQNVQGFTNAPLLIGSFLFSELTASGTKWKNFTGLLSRNAKHRTLIFKNGLNQPTSAAISVQMFDTLGGGTTAVGTPSIAIGTTIAASGQTIETSEVSAAARMAAHVDSMAIGVPMGATLPTSGQLDVYVVEYF